MKQSEILQMAKFYALSQHDHYLSMDKASRWTNEEYAAEADKWFEKYQELSKMYLDACDAERKEWKKEVESLLAGLTA